ncbi:MAG: hypothetical protein KC649_08055 [Candidatus Omnitrophica bacterium]|nr:hypothetical protein [Candidatus Omnitrophota bacterium]
MHRKSAIRHVKQEIEKERSNRVRYMFLSVVLCFTAIMSEAVLLSGVGSVYLHIIPAVLIVVAGLLFHEFRTTIPKRLELLEKELNSL